MAKIADKSNGFIYLVSFIFISVWANRLTSCFFKNVTGFRHWSHGCSIRRGVPRGRPRQVAQVGDGQARRRRVRHLEEGAGPGGCQVGRRRSHRGFRARQGARRGGVSGGWAGGVEGAGGGASGREQQGGC